MIIIKKTKLALRYNPFAFYNSFFWFKFMCKIQKIEFKNAPFYENKQSENE